ncbi:MAG: 4Fe-4S cluster-binding domain-containing protein, partial [Actinobacteria bacterium]|nr:4Fe-4S cluster-binding domain-containing protein [Actinomycetota bacterium]
MHDKNIALVTDFLDFQVHDGYGLRLTVFLKGCPLDCKWCQNPETQARFYEVAFYKARCIACRKCKDICPVPGAILQDDDNRI